MSEITIRIGVLNAKGLAAADKTGFSDPYVVLRVNHKKYKTKSIKQTLNPVWDAHFDTKMSPKKTPTLLSFTVWDKDTIGRDFLGEVSIPFKNIFDRNNQGISDGIPRNYNDPNNYSAYYQLAKRSEKNNVSGDLCLKFGIVEDYVGDDKRYADAWALLID
ncbi:C2 domain-containing protein [Gilbertella persicaria]|uniref:C2 domain-containing protein n=1 Tax=Gilbertella persicaria TaxID=101096 RepID=UPI00221F086C|nr:C2 domain-containing protein [Gilbertella persicaria]KAI8078018.1 C2 domain-containing protein [Gilbertella persicaria]